MSQVATAPAPAQAPAQAPMSIVLPRVKLPAITTSPKKLVLFSKPKVGKTTLLAALPGCLIIDLENGTDFVDAIKLKAYDINGITQIGSAILAERNATGQYPYQYVALDTVTALEDMCIPYALQLYRATPMGAGFLGQDVRQLPNGAGWLYMREAFEKVIKYVEQLAPRIILVGHIADKLLAKEGREFTSAELDLTGKLKKKAASEADAIGYLYRTKDGQAVINFKSSEEITCGARPQHLKGQEIVISEEIDGKVEVYWDRIFID